MQQNHRPSIVISALLTSLIMTLVGGGMLAYSGLFPVPSLSAQSDINQLSQEKTPIIVTVQPILAPEIEQMSPMVPVESIAIDAVPDIPATPVTDTPVSDTAVPDTVRADMVAAQIAEAVSAQQAADAEALAAYQTQLEEAYTALQEAYTQIDVLQQAQAQPVAVAYHDNDDEHGESKEHDEDENDEDENDEDENDDD